MILSSEFLYGFLSWFKAFFGNMLDGFLTIFKGLFYGVIEIFNFPYYFQIWSDESVNFGALDWILSILAFILTFAIWVGLLILLILVIRKFVRYRKTLVGNEDLLEEISELHNDVVRLTDEKERIMRIKVTQAGLSYDQMKKMFEEEMRSAQESVSAEVLLEGGEDGSQKTPQVVGDKRFARLSAIDEKYTYYTAPEYVADMSLSDICEDLRNFACSQNHLYYDIRTIRMTIAGFASTKLIILQGISGTGKTSLPYVMGKYFKNDATITAVQPSWRDRNELFGYFNEFTKKFNETEVLTRIYEAGYNDDLNIIVLDEMNISRVEYYFAEMLSILEMPNSSEWNLEIVPSTWPTDPVKLQDGKLHISENIWYIGTINNDDSTFSVSDKVYDRAFVINLDSKGIAFDAPKTEAKDIAYSYIDSLYKKAFVEHPVSDKTLQDISKLDLYVIEKFRVAFGNRIMKQLKNFVPVYVACGGDELEAVDYMLATKVLRKFDSLNISLIRDEIRGLITFLDNTFGKNKMKECIEYLKRLQKTY